MVKCRRRRQYPLSVIEKHLPAFLDYLVVERDYRPNTINSIKSKLKITQCWLTKNKQKFNEKDIRKYILYLKQRETHNRYIEGFISSYRIFCDYLVKIDKIKYNWARDLPMPKRIVRLPNILSAEEINAILKAVPSYRYKPQEFNQLYATAIALLAKTGMRVGELTNLRIENLDLKASNVKIKQTKTRRERIIPLPPELIKPLEKLVKGRSPPDYVFISVTKHHKLSPRLLNNELKARAEIAKITKRVYAHLLRHSFITELLRQDISILKVASIVGHEQVATTQQYTHLLYEDLKQALLRHPLIRKHRNPYEIIDAIKKDIKSYHLEEDSRIFYELTEGNEGMRISIFIR